MGSSLVDVANRLGGAPLGTSGKSGGLPRAGPTPKEKPPNGIGGFGLKSVAAATSANYGLVGSGGSPGLTSAGGAALAATGLPPSLP
jgi:hypothetical protein